MGSLDERLGEAPVNDETHGRKNRSWEEIESETTITTRGDIVVGDAVGAAVRLPLGAEGTVLQSKSGDLAYDTIPGGGGGDMLRSVYDTGENGIVDNSENLEGNDSAYHLDRANQTGSQAASTISDFDTEVANETNVAANTTHRSSDGKDHSDVVLNNTHRTRTDDPHDVTKVQVSLGNVDDTSDTNKPVSTAQQTEIDTKEDGLGNPSSDGDILSSTIAGARSWINPSAGGGQPLEVEDEGSSLDSDVTKLNFIGVGVTAVENADHEIDITIPGGSGLVLGETDTTAYRGDRGKTAYDHSQLVTGNPHSLDTDDVTEATNEYYTEAKVDANSNVSANTAKRTYPSADETKLSGIEALAEVNQSDSEIKTQYENNADTNVFTDSEKTNVASNTTHSGLTNDPHSVTKAQVSLGNVDDVQQLPLSQKGAANGVATLDASSKLPAAQLPVSATEYLGAWNASTNTPTLIDGTGTNGDMYRVSVGGSQDLGSGSVTYVAGDAIIYNGTIWEKIPSEDLVQSVNSQAGVVVLDSNDISENTNLYYTEARVDANTNVAANTTHSGSDGKNHSDVVLNNTHRGSDGKDHSDVVTNNAKVSNANHSGDATGDTALTIANDAVTYAKMQNVVADQILLGNIAGAAGIITELTAAQVRTLLSLVIGTDVLAEQAIGIADNNLLEVDGDPNSAEYARFTANGMEGRTEAEFKTDFNLEIGTDVQKYIPEVTSANEATFNSGNPDGTLYILVP